MHFGNHDEKRAVPVAVLKPATEWTHCVISNELSRSCRCFRFRVVSRDRVLICWQQQGCCALYEQVVQTPTARWQNYRGGMPLACRVPAVNEGLQPVVMINGKALSHFIDFTSSAISGCRFTAVQTGGRIKGHVKTIWRSPRTRRSQSVTSFHAKITQTSWLHRPYSSLLALICPLVLM